MPAERTPSVYAPQEQGDAILVLEELARRAGADAVLDLQWGVALGSMLADGYRFLEPDAPTPAEARIHELDRQIGVLCEAASRLRPLARRAITESGAAGDEARRELHEGIDWIVRGGVEPPPWATAGEGS